MKVKDSGIGISKTDQQKLFGAEHFSRKGTENEKGSGLGLLLVRDFVEKNYGSIKVESQLNVGTEFRVSFQMKGDPLKFVP